MDEDQPSSSFIAGIRRTVVVGERCPPPPTDGFGSSYGCITLPPLSSASSLAILSSTSWSNSSLRAPSASPLPSSASSNPSQLTSLPQPPSSASTSVQNTPLPSQLTTSASSSSLGCSISSGAFGGVVSCVPDGSLLPISSTATSTQIAPPPSQSTASASSSTSGCSASSGAFGGAASCVPNASLLPVGATATLETITATQSDQQGQVLTTVVTWLQTGVLISTSVSGTTTQTIVPGWICLGNLCNPGCTLPVQKCDGQDGPGLSGFPWPKVGLKFYPSWL